MRKRRVPLVLQYEIVECGAASLSMILRYYGCYLPLHILRSECGVSRDGSNLLDIKQAAENRGLNVRAGRFSAEELMEAQGCFPCIAWWDQSHFVVLEGKKGNKMLITDPALGRYSADIKGVNQHFAGLILHMVPDNSFKKEGKPENYVMELIPILQRYKKELGLLAPLTVALVVPTMLEPGLTGAFVGEVLTNERYQYALPILWLSVITLILLSALTLIRLRILRLIYLQLTRILFNRIAKKLLSVTYLFFTSRYLGDITSRVEIAEEISSTLALDLTPFVLGLISAFVLIPVLWVISPYLSLFTFLYVAISLAITIAGYAFVIEQNKLITLIQGKLSGLTIRIFSDIKTIKASALENQYLGEWQTLYQPVFEKQQEISRTSNNIGFLSSLNGSIYDLGSIALSGYLVMVGDLNLAGFMAYQAIRSQVTQPLVGLSGVSGSVQELNAELGRLNDLWSVEEDTNISTLQNMNVGSEEIESNRLELKNAISVSMNEISVQLSPIKPPLLDEVSFDCPAASMVTVLGPSGSGKSVLLKTISGLYKASSGEILYDSQVWQNYSKFSIRAAVGYVGQEVTAIRGSVLDNITMLDPEITEEDVWDACGKAEFSSVVKSLPSGLYTQLGNSGTGLSGGQLQRMQIARALVRKPKILLLDEATSSLDIPTERRLLRNLKQLKITLICVAHRLISAEMSDHIIILKDGNLIESGNPKELKNDQESFYFQLHQNEKSEEDQI